MCLVMRKLLIFEPQETNLTGIHWKGDANYMLSCCTKHDSESGYIEMSDDKVLSPCLILLFSFMLTTLFIYSKLTCVIAENDTRK